MTTRRHKRPVLLYTLHCGNFYGTERMALATVEQFADFRCILIAPRGQGHGVLDEARKRGLEAIEVNSTYGFVWAALAALLGTREIDVISTSAKHNALLGILGRLLLVRIRQLNVVHGGGDDRYSYANKHRLNRSSIRLIAISQFVRAELVRHGVDPEKIGVIPNFLSRREMASRPRRPPFGKQHGDSRPIRMEEIRVAIVSRADPIKRLDVLLDAVAGGGLSHFRFDVYGDGEELQSLRDRAATLGGLVTFHGYVADVPIRLAEADLLLHLCPNEPFGLVILEGMAACLPVVVPDTGGAAELIEDRINGYKYRGGDAAALVAVLREIVCSSDNLDSVVDNGLRCLSGEFSPERGGAAYRRALGHT